MNIDLHTQESIEKYSKVIAKFGLLNAFLGAVLQYISLLLIGSGTWIMSYYSPTFIVFEGLNYFLYFTLFIFTIRITFPFFENILERESRIYRIFLSVVMLVSCLAVYIWSKEQQIRTLAFPFILIFYSVAVFLFVSSFGKKYQKPDRTENENNFQNDFFMMYLVAILFLKIISYMNPNLFYSNNFNLFDKFPTMKKEFRITDNVKTFYKNDTYLFVRFEDEHKKEKIIIRKIEDLLDSRSNSAYVPTILPVK